MHDRQEGFTLIELLVVIAIIAILMGIMVPALIAVRNRAQTIVCAANLRNYGSALHMYAQSNDEKAPFATSWLYSQKTISNDEPRRRCPRGCKWHYDVNEPDGSLWPYLKDKNVHMCPTFRRYARQAECPNPSHSNAIPYNPMYSYSMNYFLGFDWATGLRISFSTAYEREVSLKLTRVTRPAKCFAFSEENLWVINTDVRDVQNYSNAYLNDNALWMAPNAGRYMDNMATYHNVSDNKRKQGVANAVFVDGHVDTIQSKAENGAYLEYARPYEGHEKLDPIW